VVRVVDRRNVALRLAEAVLLHRGRLSIKDIEAMPFLEEPEHAALIANHLVSKFGGRVLVELEARQDPDSFEECIQLASQK
jgi:hypothetical protein